ncbi:uncharacterized protein VDAG_05905 [Verticillium dahliae VdLs.17]|uniref:Uncharacterized protein n=1 Tax=Verticillium dahliae (strain VdLs.17 / ATCC MYA-4575 / FGSC 10137) TaxID=498257 RepID=G2X6X3_VERDV|nr:uncharacterized protein VDAG_05905 [Verticillium dahliae VdLs.17]EGY14741.1 hypothetical protein VDAG_05905 [Verticillium dahliae VdLs.17]KAH6708198.1 hypothetical protein EV126DRAFT_456707 [Verticillium dahliae]
MVTITKQAEGGSHAAQPTAAITQISAKYIRAESSSWTVKGQAGSNTTEHHTVTPPRTIAVPLKPKETGASAVMEILTALKLIACGQDREGPYSGNPHGARGPHTRRLIYLRWSGVSPTARVTGRNRWLLARKMIKHRTTGVRRPESRRALAPLCADHVEGFCSLAVLAANCMHPKGIHCTLTHEQLETHTPGQAHGEAGRVPFDGRAASAYGELPAASTPPAGCLMGICSAALPLAPNNGGQPSPSDRSTYDSAASPGSPAGCT